MSLFMLWQWQEYPYDLQCHAGSEYFVVYANRNKQTQPFLWPWIISRSSASTQWHLRDIWIKMVQTRTFFNIALDNILFQFYGKKAIVVLHWLTQVHVLQIYFKVQMYILICKLFKKIHWSPPQGRSNAIKYKQTLFFANFHGQTRSQTSFPPKPLRGLKN